MIGSSEERIESSLKISVWSHKTFFGILVRDLRLCSLVAQTVKAFGYNAGDLGSIPGLGRSPGE